MSSCFLTIRWSSQCIFVTNTVSNDIPKLKYKVNTFTTIVILDLESELNYIKSA